MMDQETQNAGSMPTGEDEGSNDSSAFGDSILQVETLAAERDKLQAEREEAVQRSLRLAAEFDNFRKRAEKERGEYLEYAASDTVKALLPVLDDFERALKVETADAEYARGVGLIHQRLSDLLTKLGLEPLNPEGQVFDPNQHYAVDRVESTDIETDMVSAVYQKGYLFKGRLLRPAMVRVAVKA